VARSTDTTSPALTGPRGLAWLVGFLIVVIVPGGLIGAATAPGAWYAALEKPPFNPPDWVFAPTWFVLYALIAFAGWRIWMTAPRSAPMVAWVDQLALNWLWSPVFFTLHLVWLAVAIVAAMAGLIAYFIWTAKDIDGPGAWAFVPYLAWVSFATVLNASVAVLN